MVFSVAYNNSSDAGRSLASAEVPDLVAAVDCLMLPGSYVLLDFLGFFPLDSGFYSLRLTYRECLQLSLIHI